jgi:alkanesulfonate monooxygenase SsuD/methylene tetrahydromethanopterin reductase-like flavin-dependent oxidoreductase (luciferase family)
VTRVGDVMVLTLLRVAGSSGSGADAVDAARFRLAWALAHSKRAGDAARAVSLLQEVWPGSYPSCSPRHWMASNSSDERRVQNFVG